MDFHKFKNIALISGLSVLLLASAAYTYIQFKADNKYQIRLEYKQIEQELDKLLASNISKLDKIQQLQALKELPEILENRRNFALAQLYKEQKEIALEFICLNKITESYPAYKYAKFRLIKLAEKYGYETKINSLLEKLIQKYPNSTKLKYAQAKAYLRQNQSNFAEKIFIDIENSEELDKDNNYKQGANFYLANLTADKVEKKNRLLNYINNNPGASLANIVVSQLINNFEDIEKTHPSLIANTLSRQGRHQEALKLFESSAPDFKEEYYINYLDSLIAMNQKQRAISLVKKKLFSVKNVEIAKAMLDKLLSIQKSRTNLYYLKLIANQPSIIKDKILWHIASYTKSRYDYQKVYNRFPQCFYAAESLANNFMNEYKRGSYHKAKILAKQHWQDYPYANSHAKVAFFISKMHLKNDNKQLARETLSNLVIDHPHHFYGYRAQQILKHIDDTNQTQYKWWQLANSSKFTLITDWSVPELYDDEYITETYGKGIAELVKSHQFNFIQELVDNGELRSNKEFEMWLYAKLHQNLKSIRTAYKVIANDSQLSFKDISSPIFQYLYPVYYADIIADRTSIRNRMDQLMVQALIRQESTYQADIVSKAGAIGLMQLMPFTAREVARRLKMFTPSMQDLQEPATNIKLGVDYMEGVFNSFKGNMIFAIASYNAGSSRIRQWAKKYNFAADADEFIENIPYSETKNYVKRVLENYWVYQELYRNPVS